MIGSRPRGTSPLHKQLSSPGFDRATQYSSALMKIAKAVDYWIPAFAGMTLED
jgi:hypothetical protein